MGKVVFGDNFQERSVGFCEEDIAVCVTDVEIILISKKQENSNNPI